MNGKRKTLMNVNYLFFVFVSWIGNFKLRVEGGSFRDSEIIVLLGQNGTGKKYSKEHKKQTNMKNRKIEMKYKHEMKFNTNTNIKTPKMKQTF